MIFDRAIEELRMSLNTGDKNRIRLDPYAVKKYLELMRANDNIPLEEIARREYLVLPMFAYSPEDLSGFAIYDLISKDPDLFVDLICDVYLPAHRDKFLKTEPTDDERARGQVAFTLIRGMRTVPGKSPDNAFDYEFLKVWVEQARSLAAEKDRSVTTDITIGNLLAYASDDPVDSCWPHQAIRQLMEEIGSDDIERGIATERVNMRGVFSKALYEGGQQERDFADQYDRWADKMTTWPRCARLLRAIAEDWRNQGLDPDIRGEIEKREF